MDNFNNEKSGIDLAAEQEIQDVINPQNGEIIVVDPKNPPNNGFILGTGGGGRTFCVKKDLIDKMLANKEFSESE